MPTGKGARRKGHSFERWLVKFFKDRGWGAQRGLQAHGGSGVADVIVDEYPLDGLHIEAKRYARFAVYKHWKQALTDSGAKEPVVILKADNEEPLVLMSLKQFELWASEVAWNKEGEAA